MQSPISGHFLQVQREAITGRESADISVEFFFLLPQNPGVPFHPLFSRLAEAGLRHGILVDELILLEQNVGGFRHLHDAVMHAFQFDDAASQRFRHGAAHIPSRFIFADLIQPYLHFPEL